MNQLILCVSMCVLFLSVPVKADTLLASFDYTGIGRSAGQPEWQPFLSYGNPDDPGSVVMNGATLDFLAVTQGTRYDLTGNFASFASLATNGSNNAISIGFHNPSGSSQSLTSEFELLTWGFAVPGVGAPDFAGFTLTRIEVLGSSLTSLGHGVFEVSTNYSVFGNPVPEPATVALLAIGATALALLRLARRY